MSAAGEGGRTRDAGPLVPRGAAGEGGARSPLARTAGWIVRIGLTLGVTWLLVRQVGLGLDEVVSRDALPAPSAVWALGASVGALLVAFGLASWAWGWMVRDLGQPSPGPLACIRIVLTANLGRYVPGKVWQIAGLALLARRAGVPGTTATAAAVLGQLFHLAGAGAVGLLLLAVGRGDGAGWRVLGDTGVLIGAGALTMALVLASIPGVVRRGLALAYRFAGIGAEAVPRPDPLFGPRWILLHAGIWLVYGVAFALLVRGFGLELPLLMAISAFAAAYLLGYLALFAPAGIGVREGVLIALLQPQLGTGAVGVAVIARLWMTLVEVIPAGAMALWEIFRRRRAGGGFTSPQREDHG